MAAARSTLMPRELNRAQIRIVIVDDHPVVRSGLATMLSTQQDFNIVGEAPNGHTALKMIPDLLPDVVLLDLRMPDMDGVEVLRKLTGSFPEVKVLILTNYEMEEDIYRTVEAGARGYLIKDVSLSEITQAIHSVHAGRREFPKSIADRLAQRMCRSNLTHRESGVLELLVKGLTNKQIGIALEISEHTARNHVIKILAKLEVSDRSEAVGVALQQGIVKAWAHPPTTE